MINRFYLENYLSFDTIDLEFQKGLIVFTGASGAGKSILMNAILALFGNSDAKAKVSEVSIDNLNIKDENYNIEPFDEFVIKQLNTTKMKYLLNNQTISKKNLQQFSKTFTRFLHLKDTSDFQSDKLIDFLDILVIENDKDFSNTLKDFEDIFINLTVLKDKLLKINQDEANLDTLKDYLKFEIDQISSLDPKVDEYDELKHIKENISKKEKIQDILEKAIPVLTNTHYISSALQLIDQDDKNQLLSRFDDCINEINSSFESFNDAIVDLGDDDIEKILDRIEKLSKLQKKYGSISDALQYKKEKEKELEELENISFEKAILEKNINKLTQELKKASLYITQARKKVIPQFKSSIEYYLKYLYLDNLNIELVEKSMDKKGVDKIVLSLNNTPLEKVSSGEFNRLRLALLTAKSKYECQDGGILFLDEIDANLSGKESQSIAKVLVELSQYYQIFAISHQPQLSATANQHFVVQKNKSISTVSLLNTQERIEEIARMISGENITSEAIQFAQQLLKKSKN